MLQTHRPSNSNICFREMQAVSACTYAYTCASIFIFYIYSYIYFIYSYIYFIYSYIHILQALLEWILFVNKRTPLLALAFSQFAFKDRMAAMEKHSQAFFKACWFWDTELRHGHQQSVTSTPASKAWCGRGAWCTPPQLLVSCLCQLPCPTEFPSGRQWHLEELPKHVLHG